MRAPFALLLLWGGAALAVEPSPELPQRLGPPPPARVERVVTLAPSLTETVLALGAGATLVGVSRFDELPEVAKLPRVGGFVDPSLEAVLKVKPHLVLVQPAPGNRAVVEKLAGLGVSVLALPLHRLSQVERAIQEIGAALGRPEQASALVRELNQTRQRVRAQAAKLAHPRALLLYGFEPLVVAGPGTFAAELLEDAGAENLAKDARAAYPVYSVEALVQKRPEVIFYSPTMASGGEKLRALSALRGVRWVALPSQDLLHPGPHLARGLTELFSLLHP